MTGENITATLHFFDNGIFVECADLDIGKFIARGDGNALMSVVNEIDDSVNSNTVFMLTEKGLQEANEMSSKSTKQ